MYYHSVIYCKVGLACVFFVLFLNIIFKTRHHVGMDVDCGSKSYFLDLDPRKFLKTGKQVFVVDDTYRFKSKTYDRFLRPTGNK